MTTEAFAAKLEELLPLARTNPAGYRRRVWGWVLLGYIFIALLLLGSLGLMGSLLWLMLVVGAGGLILKLLIPLGYFVWKVLRSLWVSFEPPQGRRLSRAEAAPLFELLDHQTRALRAPAVHRVLLTDDYNAAVQQLPRLGVLGWPRNYLLLGLPLLQTLSAEQAAAVVAHELGHLRGGHGRFGAWVYRVNASWEQLGARLDGTAGGGLVRRFTSWYVPRFNAWSHPMRRTDEFAADAAAARLTSPAALASALCALVVREPALDQQFWKPLDQSVAHELHPPADPISRLLAVARTASLPASEEATLLRQATDAAPDPFDTHPTLGERLAALGEAPAAPALPAHSAAEAWLGGRLPALAAELDATWVAQRDTFWQERHAQLRAQRQRLAELTDKQATGQRLSDEEAWTLADYTEDHVGADESLPLYRDLFGSAQYEAAARFSVGRILLGQDDAAGLPLLEEAMRQSPRYTSAALALLQAYHQRQGNHAAIRQLNTRQYRRADVEEAALAERQTIGTYDTLLAHGLSADELAPLLAVLQDPANQVSQAWVMRKQVAHLATERPLFIVLLRPLKTKALRSVDAQAEWADNLAGHLVLPGEGLVTCTAVNGWLENRANFAPGSEVYRQPAPAPAG